MVLLFLDGAAKLTDESENFLKLGLEMRVVGEQSRVVGEQLGILLAEGDDFVFE